ncbi:MAG: nickel-dependent lactate racemase [Candidatus Omnitrophota bacterium]
MVVTLPYGKGYLRANLPEKTRILEAGKGEVIDSPEAEIKRYLKTPIGSKPLAEIVRKKKPKDVCIVVSDHTRAVPNRIILPPLLEELKSVGLPSSAIKLLVATGMHRPTTLEEKLEILGGEIVENYPIEDHDAQDKGSLAKLEFEGEEFIINRSYLGAGLKILTGLIESHFMAGFSGGRKSICPGIAGMETIKYFHSPALLESPYAQSGTLKGNPCHIFALKMAAAAGVDFILNVTLNKEKRITGLFSGDFKKAHLSGVEHCLKENLVYVNRPFEIVVTTNGGYPLDRDLYQTVKGLVAAGEIVSEGGLIICAAECQDGMGSERFRRLLFEMKGPDEFLKRISQPGFFIPDQWEVEELVKVLKKVRVQLYSTGLNKEEIKKAHLEPIESIEGAVKEGLKEYGGKANVAVIPGGPYTIAKLKKRGPICIRRWNQRLSPR